MTTVVLKADPTLEARLIEDFKAFQVPAKQAYIRFMAKPQGATLSIYSSGKVVFQGSKAQSLAAAYGFQPESSQQAIDQNQPYIGTDEVGNGSYFGGLAVVASYVTPADHAFLRELGVDDSKKLTDSRIREIAPQLMAKIPNQPLLLTPERYNSVVGQGKPYNAVSVKVALHNQAIYLLLEKGLQPQAIVIDAFTSVKNYQRYLKQEKNHFPQEVHLEEKAEGKYLAVAVSSIIARYLFLDNLDKLSAQVGMSLPSGASAQSDQVASQLLQQGGLQVLNQTAKLHFANTQKAQALAGKAQS
ncbi:ribonuclease HIII [Streptococcus sp. DD12]|uniref:ribonuclease HIII n=1 Tax=Streptococcus sp. DD12 TaxID=1777880 RepID=UPI0007925B60|nr:ribonuclease HIII [Streptococcus sp. DD12]KXT75686.1 Ribonuclease HIII [Streptococcus sp. DD12]